MTQYMLSVHHDRNETFESLTQDQIQQMYKDVDAFNQEVKAAGQWVFGGGLHDKNSATVVDATGSEAIVTDGLFAESKEYLGGFWVIEVPDLDAAKKIAAAASKACDGKVEVRPFQGE